ncbi:hypothetical protein D9M73_291470 [compost metagenome]
MLAQRVVEFGGRLVVAEVECPVLILRVLDQIVLERLTHRPERADEGDGQNDADDRQNRPLALLLQIFSRHRAVASHTPLPRLRVSL